MIQSLKTIKNRIHSTENTRKVTAAMEMISVAKLNRIEKSLLDLRPFVGALENIMQDLLKSSDKIAHPLLTPGNPGVRKALCVITSDSGLCGVYNNNIIRAAEQFIKISGRPNIDMICLGRKGFVHFKKSGCNILNAYIGMNGRYSQNATDEIRDNLLNLFVSGKVSSVHIAYTHFKTALIHEPKVEKFLNIDHAPESGNDFILEPDITGVAQKIIPKYISMKLKLIILEAFTAEHSARTVAMKTATDNAKELLDGLVLLRNKVRQANITQEIMEIISSSEALKG